MKCARCRSSFDPPQKKYCISCREKIAREKAIRQWRSSHPDCVPRAKSNKIGQFGLPGRFWLKVKKTSTCWLWVGGAQKHNGYGYYSMQIDGKQCQRRAHRVCYEHAIKRVSQGMQLDHLCRNPLCVRPSHLEEVTPAVNSKRSLSITAINAVKSRCLRGHKFTETSTYFTPQGHRVCIKCKRQRVRDWRKANPAPKKPKKPTMLQQGVCRRGHKLLPGSYWTYSKQIVCKLCRGKEYEDKARKLGVKKRFCSKTSDKCAQGHVYAVVGFYKNGAQGKEKRCKLCASVSGKLRREKLSQKG